MVAVGHGASTNLSVQYEKGVCRNFRVSGSLHVYPLALVPDQGTVSEALAQLVANESGRRKLDLPEIVVADELQRQRDLRAASLHLAIEHPRADTAAAFGMKDEHLGAQLCAVGTNQLAPVSAEHSRLRRVVFEVATRCLPA